MSNYLFIHDINSSIAPVMEKFTGSKLFGLAQSVVRESPSGEQLLPALVNSDGEMQYIGLDNAVPLTIYHKANGVTASEKQNTGYGDARSYQTFTYSNSMIIFLDRKKTGLQPEDLLLYIRANLPDQLKFRNYQSVDVRMQTINLNSQAVYQSEYQNVPARMPPRFSLLAINYLIESVFDKHCFATCP